jgi:hypothetical protein
MTEVALTWKITHLSSVANKAYPSSVGAGLCPTVGLRAFLVSQGFAHAGEMGPYTWHSQRISSYVNLILFHGHCGVVEGIFAYYARGRGFDSRTVQTFVCMNMSVCIGTGCFYV